MKVLITRTDIDETQSSRSLTGIDSAITMELYKKYRSPMHLSANHIWDKYTFIDEKNEYIGTFNTMDDLHKKNPFLGTTLMLTHEQWLDKVNPEWKEVKRYQYW
tara:strand:- start:1434 stop:1745 length:312 start_codon:yes stop_codon:yes gene_type:complete